MAELATDGLAENQDDPRQVETWAAQFQDWVRAELVWYAGSFSFHLLALSLLLLLPGFGGNRDPGDVAGFESKAPEPENTEQVITDNPPVDPGVIENPDLKVDTEIRRLPPQIEGQIAKAGSLTGGGTRDGLKDATGGNLAPAFDGGPALPGMAGIFSDGRPGLGSGQRPGTKGNGLGPRRAIDIPPPAQRAVNAALAWLARHQNYDGSWSLANYTHQCKPGDNSCTGKSEFLADSGATALGLLPFLAAGQTQKSPCHYQETVRKAVAWLIHQQQPDGNLARGTPQMMYSHGLATIALAEVYGMTADRDVGRAAQAAVNFILNAQNSDGGWRYNPKDPGDTSVTGWQLMALKSAHMAGLDVGGSAFSSTSKWLDSVAVHDGTEYAYQPGQAPAPAMTSVGLLCRQYLGAKRDDPRLTGGVTYLMGHMPDEAFPNIYYWYYATQVMHNMYGTEWDQWNRKIRNLLVDSQVRNSQACANGSWDSEKDAWGRRGGRLMQTSLSCLTLEVYYRYLPLFKTEPGGAALR
jgi:hypothetical protein